MAQVSLVRTAATASIAAGFAALCWFNKLTRQEQDGAEATARNYGSWLLGKARERLAETDPAGPTTLIP